MLRPTELAHSLGQVLRLPAPDDAECGAPARPISLGVRQSGANPGSQLRPVVGLTACLRWMVADLGQDLGSVNDAMTRTWAPDDFWQVAQPLIPVPAPRWQGGGKRRADDRA